MLCFWALSACTPDPSALNSPPEGDSRQFSAADKLAARALSISNKQALQDAEGPYAEALLCRHGMGTLAEQLANIEGVTAEQRQGVQRAIQLFDRRLEKLAAAEKRSEARIHTDLQKTAADNPDMASNARIAIGCLQALQIANPV